MVVALKGASLKLKQVVNDRKVTDYFIVRPNYANGQIHFIIVDTGSEVKVVIHINMALRKVNGLRKDTSS